MGTANIQLTDSPACGYDNVFVTVDHIEMSSNGSSWTTIPVDDTVPQPIDLLALQNGTLLSLGQAPLEAGTYQQVRLVLKANGSAAPWSNYLVKSDAPTVEQPLTTPSAQQSGFKIVGPFTVEAGTVADLILDFDACRSVVVAGNSGKFNLKPVVKAIAEVVSGSITGTTTAGSAVYAEQFDTTTSQVTVVSGTVADDQGSFTLAPIVQSSTAGSVDVVVVPPSSASEGTAIVQQVTVTAGMATDLGALTLAGTTINTASGTVTVNGVAGDANLVVDQTISTLGVTYQIAAMAETGGSYSVPLAATGPWIGNYTGTPSVTLTEDTDLTDVGQYTITATDTAGTSGSQTADVSAGDTTVSEIPLIDP